MMSPPDQTRVICRPKPPIGAGQSLARIIAVLARAVGTILVLAGLALAGSWRVRAAESPDPDFQKFVAGIWRDASQQGVSRRTFERAFAGMTPDPAVIAKTRRQAEFVKPIGDYLATTVSDKRIEKGRAQFAQWQDVLEKIERKWGVDRYIVLGVWGMETNFGGFSGDNSVIRALATLAYARYRGNYFRHELVMALKIIEEGHIDSAGMVGSWAGAMGQTQFMPTSFLRFAVDYDGDGRKNIWSDIPDALASTANYLARHGWVRDYIWGYEVVADGNVTADATRYRPFPAWAKAGVTRADGGRMPTEGEAALIQPAGPQGPAFLVTRNFKTIKSYNNSTAYALGVALLSDRIAGGGPLKTPWPQQAVDTTPTGSVPQR